MFLAFFTALSCIIMADQPASSCLATATGFINGQSIKEELRQTGGKKYI